uniref:NOP14 nucleolar protein homolog (yeast) n=1 Tax=Oncorhynchus kisutch TaxID=8019 RepID=A0A8C7D7L1_ONCKI
MGKPPKKKNLADKVRKTKTSTEIKNNPFEVKINRKKFDILGRKSKHDVGLPGVSRSKAINKRKETLLKEYKTKDKANKFIDKRFGEYDTKMDPEEKILQRFSMERQRTQDKKDMYNLNEEEELTHYGQSLSEMEKLNDMVDSDDDADEKGVLSAELTASHFGGGGLLRRKTQGEKDNGGNQRAKSRQELIEELILKSKQEKRERQNQKEESQVLTEKLDQDWKSIQGLLAHKNAPKADRLEEEDKPKLDEYDMMVRELGFEMKAQPSEKMKTPEEVAREERERLQKLEADRLRRMMGDVVEDCTKTQAHMSADDLNDGFILDGDEKPTLAYQDGKWNINEEGAKIEGDDDEEGGEGESGEEESGGEEEEEGSGEDSHSDLDSEQESEGGEEEEEEEGEKDEVPATKSQLSEEERKAQAEAAKAELPYTFKAPESYSDLKGLLQGHPADHQCIILARTQKCNHPSLAVGNKLKLQKLFGFLLEYVGELASRSPPELSTIDKMITQLYGLCQLFPEAASKAMQTTLVDSAHRMEDVLEVKGRAAFPQLDMLIYLKITALLFPTSDFRHPVTTPALLYISQALTKCPVMSLEDVTSGLVLCCLAVEYVSFSKRFCPELINFLLGVLHLAVQDKTSTGTAFLLMGYCHISSSTRPNWLLVFSIRVGVVSILIHVFCLNDAPPPPPPPPRLSAVATCMDLLKHCSSLYRELTSYSHIFQPITTLLSKHLPIKTYPAALQVSGTVVSSKDNLVRLPWYKITRGNTKEEREKERLNHKYKKEFKGALREIRKDTRFLAREKLNEVMGRDAERKRKVKELFGSLATQEGEWKALKRRKNSRH